MNKSSKTVAEAMLNHEMLHWRVVHHARKGEFDQVQRTLLDALEQAEQMEDIVQQSSYLRELIEKYPFFLMPEEIKQMYAQLLNDASPTVEDLETYEGYAFFLRS